MIHRPYGQLNPNFLRMKNVKGKYNYPRLLLDATRTNSNGYLLYRRRNMENSGFKTTIKMKRINGKYETLTVESTVLKILTCTYMY